MRRKSIRVEAGVVGLGLVFVTSFGSCGPGDAAPSDAPLELDETSVRVVGSSDAIATVQDVDVLEDGSIWVLNSVEPFFVGFGSDGEIVEEYGTRGGGPDEFDAPAGFVQGASGATAWVLDAHRNILVEVPRPSSGRSEIPLHRDSVPLGSLQPGMGMMSSRIRSASVGEATLVARSYGSLRTGVWSLWSAIWGADLVAVEPSGSGARTIVSLADALEDPSDYLEQTDGFPPVPLWLRLWTVCPDGAIRVHDRMRNAVRGFSLDGAELDAVDLPPPPFDEVTDEEFARAAFGLAAAEAAGRVGGRLSPEDSAQVMQGLVQAVQGTPERLARFLPRYVDMRCSEDGALWLQPLDLSRSDLEGGRSWVRVAPDGAARTVVLPPRFDAYRFLRGRILGIQRNQFDVASVAWVDLPFS